MADHRRLPLATGISLVTLALFCPAAIAGGGDARALMELKAAMDPRNEVLASWKPGVDPCAAGFEGVACTGDGFVANISLQGRGLSGSLSPAIAELRGLTGLYLHYNSLTGGIPPELGMMHLLTELYLGVNKLFGHIPVELGAMAGLQVLQLSYNDLSGSIPPELSKLRQLAVLALQSNRLTGAIPASVGDMPMLTLLDLSNNRLFGSIPSKLAGIPSIAVLDIRNNSLSGAVPPALRNLGDGFRCENNAELCGDEFPQLKPCAGSFGDAGAVDPKELPLSANLSISCDGGSCSAPTAKPSVGAAFVGSGAVLIVVAACLIMGFSLYRRRKGKSGTSVKVLEECTTADVMTCRTSGSSVVNFECSSGWTSSPEGLRAAAEVNPVIRFNLEELESATQYFSPACLLGRSAVTVSTYKGELRNTTPVVVKCIGKASCKAVEADLLKGLRLLFSLRHDHVVGVRGFCRSRARGECFIVYDFMANGSLSRFLDVPPASGGGGENILDWTTRVSIIKAVAGGLEYLHSSRPNKPPIVHQCISADKILLDESFAARIAGAGLCKILADDAVHSALKNSAAMGYLAPEYATTGRLTDKGDVYAFGVTVFQLLSGKKTISNLHLSSDAGRPEEIADVNLRGELSLTEATKLATIALLCTAETPSQRPAMSAVVEQLALL